MGLFCELIDREVPELHEERVQIRFIGRCDDLDDALRAQDRRGRGAHGRQRAPAPVHRHELRRPPGDPRRGAPLRRPSAGPTPARPSSRGFLYGPDLRDPELVIRTSGEQRLSNFLLWQCAYAELHFSPRLWPDFAPEDLELALADYARRHRRFGGR